VDEVEPKRTSREDWISAGLTDLGEVGVNEVRVDRIAARLGVTKGSFYWHFKDRDEFLAAVVNGWETRCTENVISRVDASGLDPQGRARRLWSMTAGSPTIRAELAIRDWARRDEEVAATVGRIDDRRMRYTEALLTDLHLPENEIPARALLVYSLLLGDHLIATTHPTHTRKEILADALALLMTR
jgi:AcrR family transcriptional regulator